MEVGTWKEGASGLRAVRDNDPASGLGVNPVSGGASGLRAVRDNDPASGLGVNPVSGAGVVTGSATDPSFVGTCVHTLT